MPLPQSLLGEGDNAVGLRTCHEGRMILTVDTILEFLRERAVSSHRFASAELINGELRCRARDAESEAWYLVQTTKNEISLLLVTPDRWLSESIEAELMHSGDDIEELLLDELIALDPGVSEGEPITVKHFRNDDRLYTFETTIPSGSDEETVLRWLLAYEATFHELGDMGGERND